MMQSMFGVLLDDGTYRELPGVASAAVFGNQLLCYDGKNEVVARFPSSAIFGRSEVLERAAAAIHQSGVRPTQDVILRALNHQPERN